MSERKLSPLWPILTAASIGLPVLYFVSTGPAIWLVRRFESDELNDVILTIYAPIVWIYYDCEWFAQCFRWWEELWGGSL